MTILECQKVFLITQALSYGTCLNYKKNMVPDNILVVTRFHILKANFSSPQAVTKMRCINFRCTEDIYQNTL